MSFEFISICLCVLLYFFICQAMAASVGRVAVAVYVSSNSAPSRPPALLPVVQFNPSSLLILLQRHHWWHNRCQVRRDKSKRQKRERHTRTDCSAVYIAFCLLLGLLHRALGFTLGFIGLDVVAADVSHSSLYKCELSTRPAHLFCFLLFARIHWPVSSLVVSSSVKLQPHLDGSVGSWRIEGIKTGEQVESIARTCKSCCVIHQRRQHPDR